jgi:uncharacterized phage protein (TIGR01671 family)
MRTLRFRAWDKINHVWVDPAKFAIQGNGEIRTWGVFSPVIVFQFTGLLDRQGKEIYEGDMVECVNGHTGIVEWEEHDACFNVTDYYGASDDYPTMAFMEGQPMEVIGNIYENKELLEVKE